MAVIADAVVVELFARLDRYDEDVRASVSRFESGMNRIERAGRSAEGAGDGLARSVGGLRSALAPLAGAVAAVALVGLAKSLIETAGEFQRLSVQLEVATGSAGNAKVAFGAIQELAAKTPFSVAEVTKAFIALKNLGLDPSAAAIVSYGNTAGALGKTLDDVVQAVADATVGEFERLKEFGIKASAQGEKVAFTFKGVTTVVENNGQAIEGYLKKIGETDFAGGMEKQSATLGGALSNLGDTANRLAVAFGEGGFSAAILEAVQSMNTTGAGADELAVQLGGLAGDAIRAAADLVGAFSSAQTDAAGAISSIRSDLAGLSAAFDGAFAGLPGAVKGAADIASATFGNFIRNSVAEIDFLQNKLAAFDAAMVGDFGRAIGVRAIPKSSLLSDFDRGRNAKAGQISSAQSARIAGKLLSTRSGGGGAGNGDILGTFGDAPSDAPSAAQIKAAETKAKKIAAAGARAAKKAATDAKREAERSKKILADFAPNTPKQIGEDLEAAQDASRKLADNFRSGIDALVQSSPTFDVLLDKTQQLSDAAADFANDLSFGLADAIVNGKSLGDVLVNSFKRAAVEALAGGLFKLISGGIGAIGGGGLLGGIGKKLVGFAGGGRPAPGVPYLVGEKGPEVRIDGPGQIIPNNKIGGGSSPVIYVTQSIRFDVGLESVDQRIQSAAPVLLSAAQRGTFEALRNSGIGRV